MNPQYLRRLRDPQGKGLLGCLIMIVLIGVVMDGTGAIIGMGAKLGASMPR